MSASRRRARLLGALLIVCSARVSTAQSTRDGSGTSWLPDASPMYAVHVQDGPWTLMLHENAFLQFLRDSGTRGDEQVGSVNWVMGMAQRNAGRGRLALRGMFSIEPWTIRGCGYPDLLASGERCAGGTIHDRQHPHDLPMEIAAEYDAPLRGAVRWQVYGGPSAEPALGPVAYPHRISAMPNPLAPVAHHWLDSTHVSFGTVTGGVYATRWKLEASAFNGREPDEHRKNIDFGALDSVSGRVWFLPTANVSLQVSVGHLRDVEAAEAGVPRADAKRLTASATFHRLGANRVSASTIAWGRNSESGHGTSALMLETSVTLADRDSWFGRLELTQKTPHDLEVPPTRAAFTVFKIQGGYTRYVRATARFKAGLGATVSAGVVPSELREVYGRRVNPGAGIFLTLRPAMMSAESTAGRAPSAADAGRTMVMVQTAFDPAKLACPAGFDPAAAPRTTYEGKTYYFCSPEDRDRFLIDPKMSLTMMPPK
jgi:YHS domain-containing protein